MLLLLDCILAITCQVLHMFCSADQRLGFKEGAGSPFGVPFRTLYDTQTVFDKGENCRCCFKVVAGEIRPVQFLLLNWLGKCISLQA